MNKLVLFDIDCTLLKSGHSKHALAFEYAVERATGRHIGVMDVDPNGRIDNLILRDMLILAGMTPDEALTSLGKVFEIMISYYRENEIDLTPYVLPGVTGSLEMLKSKGITVGLLTGNHEEIAWHKLQKAGIDMYFTFGGFGNEAMERFHLVDRAIAKALRNFGMSFDKRDVSIIGDTPRDVECGRKGGVRTIGVATGTFSSERLIEADADLVLKNLEEPQRLIDFVLGSRE